MLIYIHGADTFRSREYLKDQIAKFKKARDPQGYNVVFLDGENVDLGKIVGEFSAAPFLAEKRMVVVENVLASSDKELLDGLIGMVKNCHPRESGDPDNSRLDSRRSLPRTPIRGGNDRAMGSAIPESAVAVFWQGEPLSKVAEAKELEKLLRKEKYVKEFELLKGVELYHWARSRIAAAGGKISPDALRYLGDNAGDDLWHLNTLIEQLAAHSHDEIQLADVQLFLEEKLDDNIFNLTDAIVAGNNKLAFKLLSDQRQSGAAEPQIFGAVLWQFRTLLSMRDLFEREDVKTSGEMAETLKIHPFVAKKNWPMVKKYNTEKLKDVYRRLLEVDIKTKTGIADAEMLMDLFVGKI